MLKLLKNLLLIIVATAVMAPSLISCHNTALQVKYPKTIHRTIPYMSFVHIKINKEIKPNKCLPQKGKKIKDCEKFIKKLPIVDAGGTGSGIIVSHNKKIYILTAAHVCELHATKHTKTKYKGYAFSLISSSSISISFYGGKTYNTNISSMDEKIDLCILTFPEFTDDDKDYFSLLSRQSVYLSPGPPKIGDKVFNIAAPLGIHGKNMVLMFDGRYSGFFKGWHYYTVPTRPGSSGSAILNENFQLIGTLNVAITGMESLGVGTGWHQIRYFLDTN